MITNKTYEEVYQILSHMNKATVMKIPVEILNKIKTERDKSFITRIDEKDIFNLNNVSEETIDILLWLDVNYCMNPKEKEKIIKEFENNTNIEELKHLNNPFEKKQILEDAVTEQKDIVEYKESLWKKIINKIKKVIKTF